MFGSRNSMRVVLTVWCEGASSMGEVSAGSGGIEIDSKCAAGGVQGDDENQHLQRRHGDTEKGKPERR
jgi:hypothetical protein